ncbi:hypothetical protein JCM10213v2_006139 [Rhodosporidiobolus nylandii]
MDPLFPLATSADNSGGLDLSFLSTAHDEPRPPESTTPSPTSSQGKQGKGGKTKKTRNRKHHSCEPCRARKVKCDRQSNCASCRLHHKRCYYVNAAPIATSAEDELASAREEIERLRKLVKVLMAQGSASSSSSSISSTSSSFVPTLPSPPLAAYTTASMNGEDCAVFPSSPSASPDTFSFVVSLEPSYGDQLASTGGQVFDHAPSATAVPRLPSAAPAPPTYLDPALFLPSDARDGRSKSGAG